jgi:hypothetical protein
MAILEWVPIKTIIPSTIFAHVAVVLELNWFYNQELRSKQTLSNLPLTVWRFHKDMVSWSVVQSFECFSNVASLSARHRFL